MFTRSLIHIDKILLDPSNPRLGMKMDDNGPFTFEEILRVQEQVKNYFNRANNAEDSLNISTLYNGIFERGFITEVTTIMVESIRTGKGYYTVVEGNRRTLCLKELYEEYKVSSNEDKKLWKKKGFVELFEKGIPCNVIDNENSEKKSVILGARHHGSILEWSTFAKAQYAYKLYCNMAGEEASDKSISEIHDKVAGILCVNHLTIKKHLKAYLAYRRLQSDTTDHVPFSEQANPSMELIKTYLFNRKLISNNVVVMDPITYELTDRSYYQFKSAVSEFNKTKKDVGGEEIDLDDNSNCRLLKDTKSVPKLATIYDLAADADGNRRVAEKAEKFIKMIEDPDQKEVKLDLDYMYDELQSAVKAANWSVALEALLDRMPNKEINSEGSDQFNLTKLREIVSKIRKDI